MNSIPQQTDYLQSKTSKYEYDLSGRVISEKMTLVYGDGIAKVKKLEYLYDGNDIVGLIYNNGSTTNTFCFDKNSFGYVIGILDNSGNVVVNYMYDAYGNCTRGSTTNADLADSNPIRYRGYYFDKETGFYHLGARYYNPEWRRFISPDDTAYIDPETPNGLNLYCYCNNDPINYSDPSGHFAISLAFLIGSIAIGAVVGATMSGVTAYNQGESGWDLAWDIVGGGILGATVGAAIALGGAAGLASTGAQIAVQAGAAALNVSMGTALGISIGGMAFASATKYSLDCIDSERQWNMGGYLVEATQGAIQGVATFGIAYLGGKAGLFNKIGKFNGWYDFYIGYGGMNNLKMISYISNLIIGPSLSKMLFISGIGAGIRWIIDKLIPEF